MGCINNPDIAGTGCNFKDSLTALFFPAPTGNNGALVQGLPNDVAVPSGAATTTYAVALDTAICGNLSPIVLTASAGYSRYEWSDASAAPTRTVTAAGTYWVKGYSNCNTHIDTFRIANTILPTLSIMANSNQLQASTGFTHYTWTVNNAALPDTTGSIIATISGTYTVTGTIHGCTATASFSYQAPNAISSAGNLHYGIYPNPASGELHIASAIQVTAEIYSLEGRRLSTTDHATSIDLTTLKSGLYLIRLYDNTGREVYHNKLLKK